jgi:rod shape-determining protein MreC
MNSSRTFQTVTLTLLVVGILALALSGYLAPLSRVAFAPFVTAQTWLAIRYQAITSFMNTPRDVAELMQRNSQLEAEVSRLQAQIIELEQQNAQLPVLSALLDFNRTHPDNQYITASVIGRDYSPFLHYLIINRGSDDGLRRGMPVVSEKGLVGRVAAVTPQAARIQLITDAGSSINIRLKDSGAEAVLSGSLTGELSIDSIPQDSAVKTNEIVLTSGLGGDYPPNILIGQITSVQQRPVDLFQTATVQPVVDFAQLDIVLVIVNFRPMDISPLIPTPSAP